MRRDTEHLVDELLVMQCQDGSAEAMARLVDRWQRRLWRHAFRLTGRQDAAWEAVQEGWLGIVRGIRRLDDPARFRQWAYRIVTNKAADWIHKHQRLRDLNRELPAQIPAAPEAGGSPDAERLHAVLRRMPARQKAVLSLRYLEGFSTAEIAQVLRIPTGTVKSRLHHARRKLEKLWQRQRA